MTGALWLGRPRGQPEIPGVGQGTRGGQVWALAGLSGRGWTGCSLRQQTFLVGGGGQQEIYHFLSGNLSPREVISPLPRTRTSPLPALPAISSAGLVFLRLKMDQRDQLLEVEVGVSGTDQP